MVCHEHERTSTGQPITVVFRMCALPVAYLRKSPHMAMWDKTLGKGKT